MPSARTSGRGRGAARAAAAALLLALLALLGPSPAPARAVQTGALGFSDVSYTSWYYLDGSLGYVVDAGLMSGHKNDDGTPSGRFEPEGPVTRGQVATVLYRIANDDTSAVDDPGSYGQSTSFSDVRTNYYYTAAVEWCYGRGIVTGYKDEATQEPTGEFGPDAPVTRQELATMLWRFADSELGGAAAPSGQTYEGMPDAAMVQPFAREAVAWCFSEGILTGSKDPEGPCPTCCCPASRPPAPSSPRWSGCCWGAPGGSRSPSPCTPTERTTTTAPARTARCGLACRLRMGK